MAKTNAARILDRLNLSYRLLEYSADENDLSASSAAKQLGLPAEQIFKTLVADGDKTGIIIVSVPGDNELDLKALARQSGNKKIELVPLKKLQHLTGYVRGAVSPLGMKKDYPYYLDQHVLNYPFIVISAGIRGLQISLSPEDLIKATSAVTGFFCRKV